MPSTSRAWARSRSRPSTTRAASSAPADIFTLAARDARCRRRSSLSREGLRRQVGREAVRGHRGAPQDRARPLHLCARHPPRRRDDGARSRQGARHLEAFRAADARRRAARTARPTPTSTTSRASARRWSMRSSISSPSRTMSRSSTICSRRCDPEPLEAVDHASPVTGKTVVFTGTLEKMTRARPRPWPSGSAPRWRAPCRRRPTTSSPARRRLQAQGGRALGGRC